MEEEETLNVLVWIATTKMADDLVQSSALFIAVDNSKDSKLCCDTGCISYFES